MKSICVLGALFLMSICSYGQFRTDTTLYVTPEEEAFMIDKETKGLVKFNPFVIGIPSLTSTQILDIGYERKIGNSFSLYPKVRLDLQESPKRLGSVELSMETRYYLGMAKKVKEGSQANNLTGIYLGTYYSKRFNTDDFVVPFGADSYSYGIKLGKQNRFLNYGYIDNSISFSYFTTDFPVINSDGGFESVQYTSIGLSSGIEVGFGFGKTYKIQDNAMCPILKCTTDRRSAWKYNARRVWSIGYSKYDDKNNVDAFSIYLNPNISYESKINNSAFTINHDVDIDLSFSNRGYQAERTSFDLKYVDVSYALQLRYYFLQKNRILMGKTGNNLSGVYVSGGSVLRHYNALVFESDGTVLIAKDERSNNISGLVTIGYQKEILNNIYIDLSTGFTYGFYESNFMREGFKSIGEFKVGIMLDKTSPKSKVFRFF